MQSQVTNHLNEASRLTPPAFGTPQLRPEIAELRVRLNHELFEVVRQMPNALRTDAALLLLSMSPDGQQSLRFDLFQRYYAPAYSLLYEVRGSHLPPAIWQSALLAHACAMFLHMFDDHLIDGQQSLDSLRLQLRSTVWQQMHSALEELTQHAGNSYAGRTVDAAWSRYYRALRSTELNQTIPNFSDTPAATARIATDHFEAYCQRFRAEMAPWTVVPRLLARLKPDWPPAKRAALIQAYHSFGLAWRLLDDLQDAADDIHAGETDSAVYYALCAEDRADWRAQRLPALPAAVSQRVIDRLKQELARSIAGAEEHGWSGLARELHELAGGPGLG